MQTHLWYLYHASDKLNDGSLGKYANQFERRGNSVTLTMELDMTQTKKENGILKLAWKRQHKSQAVPKTNID